MSLHGRKSVLFMTVAESGQSNTILAIALELLTHPNVDVHVASFPVLRKRAEELSSSVRAVERKHPDSSFTFQEIDGIGLGESAELKGFSRASFPHPPLARSHDEGMSNLITLLTSWTGEEYVRVVDSCKGIIEAVNSDIVVVDALFNAACEACWSLNKRYILNCPVAPLDVARVLQPMWKRLFYYPALGSGIPFPIPWSYIPKNVALNFIPLFLIPRHPDFKELMSYRHSHGLSGKFPRGAPSVIRSVHTLCFGLPELEFPITLPANVGLYGPVTLDSSPFSGEDELWKWLDGGRTIMMSMGTHFHYSEAQVRSTIRGFIAETSSADQILWKLHDKGKFQRILDEELAGERVKERFRIVDWIDTDPGEVMRHKNVVVYIHHGGANSYYEAARAGIPQIILSQWFDLYDMAARAEYVGIGIYGNRSVAPEIDATEFGAAISRLLSPGEEGEKFAQRAKEIGELCRSAPGKKGVVAKILELVEDENIGA